MPSVRQGPLPRDALSGALARAFARGAVWPPRPRVVDAFSPTWSFGPVGQALVHAPRCHRVRASLEPRRRLPTFCNLGYDARAHPSELPDPRTRVAGTNRCRMRWPSMRFRAETSEPRTCAKQVTGRSAREKARRVSRTISHVPSSWRFGHPWSPVRLFAGLDIPVPVRPGRDPNSDGASRKATPFDGSRCLLPWRNPYATEQHCCAGAPGPSPRYAASVEALLRGSRAFGDRIATACL
jgi:hypothetical protein